MIRAGLLAATLALAAIPAAATVLPASFTGSFSDDDQVELLALHLDSPAALTLVSLGYAGGTNAAGVAIPRGGFDSMLAVFDAAGALLAQNDDGSFNVPADAVTGATFDAYLTLALAAGDYTVAVMQFDNFANGPNLADGFARTGDSTFTAAFGCTDAQPSFNDVSGAAGCGRTPNWAVDIRAEAPEPAAATLLAAGLLGLAAARRRR